jgi:AraC-like DNA-binding protein
MIYTCVKTFVKQYGLMDHAILGLKVFPELVRLGYYISPPGGARSPYRIPAGKLVVEWMTAGQVRDPLRGDWVGPGGILLHTPGEWTVHRTQGAERYECMSAHFRLAEPLENLPVLTWREEDGGVAFAREMLSAHHREQIPLDILGPLIWSRLRLLAERERQGRSSGGLPRRIEAVMEEIDRRFDQPLRMETLAAGVGLSVSHFQRRFKEVAGMTPHRYLMQVRLRAARHGLVTTQDPVKVVAVDTGFASVEHFCRVFRQAYGETPAGFRRRMRGRLDRVGTGRVRGA